MARGTICLSFDFDAFSIWVNRGMTTPGPLSRGEFGALAVTRILRLLRRRGVAATFFVPGHTADTFPEVVRRIHGDGHEVGMHGYLHEAVSSLSLEREREVARRAHGVLSGLLGAPPAGNRTPSWDFTPHTIPILVELGVRYDSSLMSRDYAPFHPRQGDEAPVDGPYRFGAETAELVEIPVSWSLDDYPALEYSKDASGVLPGLRRPDDVFANFLDDVRYMVRDVEDGVCTITFHPQVIGRGHRLLALERFVDTLLDMGMDLARLDTVADVFAGGRAYGTERPE